MTIAVVAALSAAICSGLAAVLQAMAVARVPVTGAHPGLLWRLARSSWYRAALLLVALGFLMSFVALRELPVFVVAVARASSLGVTALLAWPVLGVMPRRRDVLALVAVGAGLLLVVGSARAGPPDHVATTVHVTLAGVLAANVLMALVLGRHTGPRIGGALAVVAGLDFGLVGLGARSVDGSTPVDLLTDPAAWVVLIAGLHGLLTYAVALQRAAVTSATALMVGVETLFGALIGVVLLADSSRPGWAAVSVAGFALALGGAVVLASEQRTVVPVPRDA